MSSVLSTMVAPHFGKAAEAPSLALQGYTHDERRTVLPALLDALLECGCWVRERKAASVTLMELRFEARLSAVVELYSSLIGAGLELTRDSHLELTGLCTLRRHHPAPDEIGRVLQVRLEISFLEGLELHAVVAPASALA